MLLSDLKKDKYNESFIQTADVAGRSIADNLTAVKTMFISFDAKIAFHSVSHNYIAQMIIA
jgi:hypothetical protein